MLDSLVRSPVDFSDDCHTIPLFSPRTKSKGVVTPDHPLPMYGCHSLVLTLS
jgi:hypothetical protein